LHPKSIASATRDLLRQLAFLLAAYKPGSLL